MSKVEIYTWQSCPYCLRAKNLLDQIGVSYEEHPIDGDQIARMAMTERAEGRTTVPQIFINDKGIGGCDELHALERSNQLDKFLGLTN